MSCPYCEKEGTLEVQTTDCKDREGTPKAIYCSECGINFPMAYCPDNSDDPAWKSAENWMYKVRQNIINNFIKRVKEKLIC